MGADKGKARRYQSQKQEVIEVKKEMGMKPVIKVKKEMGMKPLKNVIKKSFKLASKNPQRSMVDKMAKQVSKDVNNMAQFSGKAAKEVVKDVQGLAKMIMKGFGN